ncbi:MAG: DUF1003 domain-containing protein [Candidatus Pacebacteria bacterium]|nr:DUF1003 domain-containing protein [Candidatus Paceibacterota bacterium]
MPSKKPEAAVFSQHLKSRLAFRHSLVGRFADLMTHWFGTVTFLFLNFVIFVVWILWNEGILGLEIFDPFPYSLLTMAVSLEAIALSVIVLISQNRQGHIADIREKLDFEIDVRSEEEITKMLIMLDEIQRHLGMRRHLKDADLAEMKANTDIEALRREAESIPDS